MDAAVESRDEKGRPILVAIPTKPAPEPPPLQALAMPSFDDVLKSLLQNGGEHLQHHSGGQRNTSDTGTRPARKDELAVSPFATSICELQTHLANQLPGLELCWDRQQSEKPHKHTAQARTGQQVREFPISPFECAVLLELDQRFGRSSTIWGEMLKGIDDIAWNIKHGFHATYIDGSPTSVRRLLWRVEHHKQTGFLADIEIPFEHHIMHLQTALQLAALKPQVAGEILAGAMKRLDADLEARHKRLKSSLDEPLPTIAWG